VHIYFIKQRYAPSNNSYYGISYAFTTPDSTKTVGKRLAYFIALLPDHHPLNKDRVILARQLKQKGS
jgi:hypothetical protein